jgi:hypothetical protein
MVQDDSYYLNLGYEYARKRKELDLEEDEKQRALAALARANEVIEESKRVKEEVEKTNRKAKEIHYLIEHFHDHDDDTFVETDHGTVIMNIYGDNIPPEIRRLIDDDSISPEEFKKMDIVHKTKRL